MIRYLLLTLVLLVASANAQPPAGGGGTTDPTQFWPLHVFKSGTGSGTITGAGPISCGTSCTASYVNGVTTIIYATASPGSNFVGWSGACVGFGPCTVTMISVKNVTANFSIIASSADVFAGPPPAPGGSTGNCLTRETACDVFRALDVVQCNQALQLNNGNYQGVRYMLSLALAVSGKSCSIGNEIIVFAETDGGVFIDGQFINTPLETNNNSFWRLSGFDVGNGSIFIGGGSNITIQRVCAANSQLMLPAGLGLNTHVFTTNFGNTASLYEDICVFGTGRNMSLTSYQSPNSTNIYRRFWMNHEGYGGLDSCDAGPAGQWNYHDNEPYPNIIENVISASTYENLTPGHGCYCPAAPCSPFATVMEASHGNMLGYIIYHKDPIRFTIVDGGFFARNFCLNGPGPQTYTDVYADARNQLIRPFVLTSEGGACVTANRLTALRTTDPGNGWNGAGTASFFPGVTPTNFKECIGAIGATGPNIAGCPNFYTGDPGFAGGQGSRSCYEYRDGILQDGSGGAQTIPLWPWRMDDRIKAARARANAAGLGGSPLDGGSGPGYAANTVTSEIVSRYGAIPANCLR